MFENAKQNLRNLGSAWKYGIWVPKVDVPELPFFFTLFG